MKKTRDPQEGDHDEVRGSRKRLLVRQEEELAQGEALESPPSSCSGPNNQNLGFRRGVPSPWTGALQSENTPAHGLV